MKVTRTMFLGVALAILAATVWLHWPAVNCGFLTRMDDDEYLRLSMHWQGLSWGAVRWAFTSAEPYYQPLPRLSHVLDYQLWGTNARGHHATSVAIHAFNAALVFGFLWTLLGVAAVSLTTSERLALAIGVAVAFAIHPLQVESVAWMSGRTQLLCTTFGIGSLWAYAGGARRRVVWALFVAALFCKPLAVSLPFAMLALDYLLMWRDQKLSWGRLLRRNAALIAVGVAAAVVTIITESRAGGLLVPFEVIRPSQRVLLTAQSMMFYPWKLVWPVRLSPYYPRSSDISLSQPFAFASLLGVVMITALCLGYRRRAPVLLAGWGTYGLFILPVSGLTPTGGQAVADRYAYLAMLPLLVLAGGGLLGLWRATHRRGRPGSSKTADATERVPPYKKFALIARCGLACMLAGELLFFGIRTRAQTLVWRNDETLWRGVLAQFPDSDQANEMLAQALLNQNRTSEALAYAQHAVEVAPSAETHRNLGIALAQAGKIQEAIGEFNLALQFKPDMADTHCLLGIELQKDGKFEEAVGHYQQALRVNPGYAEAHYNLGVALVRLDHAPEAMAQWEEALRIDPEYAEAHGNLGVALEQAGKLKEAVTHYEQALRISPDIAVMHYDLGNALVRLGRVPEAIQHYEEALRLKPDYAEARSALARLR
jgi:tetratricopeptide (TPR) repeat protein